VVLALKQFWALTPSLPLYKALARVPLQLVTQLAL
jgi:hypothetical protein